MLRNEDTMNYDENLFKEKANIKAMTFDIEIESI